MSQEEIARSLRFPKELWDLIDRDAALHKRSSVKHLEFLLTTYYREEMPIVNIRRMINIKVEPTGKIEGSVENVASRGTDETVPLTDDGFITADEPREVKRNSKRSNSR